MSLNYKKFLLTLLFPFIEFKTLLIRLFLHFNHPKGKIEKFDIIILKLDAIGDYILFRNFLEIIRNKNKNKKILFLGNIKFKDLALELDSQYIDKFIFIDHRKMLENQAINRYSIDLFKELKNIHGKQMINCTFSRSFFDELYISRNIKSDEKIAMRGDSLNTTSLIKFIHDLQYSKLIEIDKDCILEFDRNKNFIEKLFKEKFNINRPYLPTSSTDKIPKGQYVVLFPGAGQKYREWSTENFVNIAKYIIEKYKYKILIAGGKNDVATAEKIIKQIENKNIINMTGQTSFLELASIIKFSKLLISNDTSAVHVAASVDANTIFFLIGNNEFGRFGPYPPKFKNMHAIYPIDIESNENNYIKLAKKYKKFPKMYIDDIKVEKVINKINEII